MNRLKWKRATRAQLCIIAFEDKEAPLKHRLAALAELNRRDRPTYTMVQYKMKRVYLR